MATTAAGRQQALGTLKSLHLASLLLVFVATWINPHWLAEQALRSALTVVGVVWLVLHARGWRLLDRSPTHALHKGDAA